MAEDKKKDLYSLFGVSWTASQEDIKKAYFRLVKDFHPDAISDEEERANLEAEFLRLTEAYNTLRDPQKRKEYDKKVGFDKAKTPEELAEIERRIEHAKYLFKRGLDELERGNYWSAIECFKVCINYNDRNPYYLSYYGYAIALSGNKRRLKEASEFCQKAINIDKFQPEFYHHLGEVYERAGLISKAIDAYEDGLKWDAENAHFKKRIQVLYTGKPIKEKGKASFLSKLFRKKK